MEKKSNLLPKYIVVFFVVVCVFQIVAPMFYIVDGTSMEPTFNNGEITVINYYGINKKYEYGDVVVIENVASYSKMIKRVIGVSGDHIVIKDNNVYINGEQLVEDYILEPMEVNDMDFIVQENKYFVMGDNRNMSVDSRKIGLIDYDNIIGKVVCQF